MHMAYVIAAPCIGVKDRACVDACPVDCIYEGAVQLHIDPIRCIDCGACEPVCPVGAILLEADLPGEWEEYAEKAVAFFRAHPDAALAGGKTRRR